MKPRELFESLPPSLRERNAHLVHAPARENPLDTLRRAAVPPSELPALDRALAARAEHAAHGAAAHAAGESFEAWCAAQHRYAIEHGHALVIEKIGAPSEPHVEGGRVQFDGRGRLLAAISGTAPPDYLGATRDRMLVIEAKHRAGRLHRDRERPDGTIDRAGIARHQRDALTRYAQCAAALVLVVVEFERAAGPLRFAVPWTVLDTFWTSVRGGPPSVGPKELAAWPARGPSYLIAFLEGR